MNYVLTPCEREIVARYDEESRAWTIYATSERTRQLLEEFIAERPLEAKLSHRDEQSITITVPKEWVRIKPPAKQNLTEEQREERRERMRRMRDQEGA